MKGTLFRRQRGLTLIEIMIAVTLGLILTAGIIQIFVGSKRTYHATEGLARMQENGRFITDVIAHDLRHVLYRGCVDPNNPANTAYISTVVTDPFDPPIVGYDNSGTLPAGAVAGTDAVTVRFAEPRGIPLKSAMADEYGDITVASDRGLSAGDVAIIADCVQADVFTITDVIDNGSSTFVIKHDAVFDGDTVNQNPNKADNGSGVTPLSKAYGTDAQLMILRDRTYFVRNTGRTAIDGTPILALARRSGGQVEDLIEGVANLQILYGERLANGNVRFVPAGTSGLDMNKVAAVQVGILLQTVEAVGEPSAANQTFTIAGTSVTVPAGDRRLWRAFNVTTRLRNQLPENQL